MAGGPNRRDGDRGLSRRDFLEVAAAGAAGIALVGCADGEDGLGPDAANPDGASSPADARTVADAAVPDAGPLVGPEEVPLSDSFGLGVASGDVTHERAVIWTRYDGTAVLGLTVWQMDGDDYVRVVNQRELTPGDGGFARADVYGLTAGARHRYAFFELDEGVPIARSEVGHLRAALAPGALEPLLFGASSCSSNGRAFPTLLHAGSRTDLDAHFLLGDTVYADNSDTVDEFRARWAENLATDGYRALRASTSVMATWDDHEIDNDFNPETMPAAVLKAATDSFFDHLPLRRQPGAPNRIWKSIRWGDTAEVFALDCRGERRPSTRGDADEQYLSPEQMTWLEQGLSASTAVFKIILNSVPIANFPSLFDAASGDRWEGYPSQRERILRHIDDNAIGGVVWLAGDFHLACVGRIDTGTNPGANQIEALCGPAGQFGNPLSAILNAPQFDWAATTNNYTTLALEPSTRTVTFTWIDGDGQAIHTQSYTL